jgi:hypothetical protein
MRWDRLELHVRRTDLEVPVAAFLKMGEQWHRPDQPDARISGRNNHPSGIFLTRYPQFILATDRRAPAPGTIAPRRWWRCSRLRSDGGDPLTTDCARHGHRADCGQRAGGADMELVHDAVCARLDVEELLVGRR